MRQLLLLLVLSCPLFLFAQTDTLSTVCCGGKCTGSAYCTACKNCSGCKHCNSGGSCGVCSNRGSSSGTTKTYETTKKSKSSNTYGKTPAPTYSSDIDETLVEMEYSTTQDLNMRVGPGTSFDVVLVLKKDEVVTATGVKSGDWIQVRVEREQNGESKVYVGFIHRNYVK